MLPQLCSDDKGCYYYDDMPARLADNIKSGYAKFYNWDYAINNFSNIIKIAFDDRISLKSKIVNSRIQMQHNTTGRY